MKKFMRMLGEYYFGTESIKQSRYDQSFLREFYPDTAESNVEKNCAWEAIFAAKTVPVMWQIGGLACSLADRNPYGSIGLIVAGELWRFGAHCYRMSTKAYAKKVKKSLIEFEQLKQSNISMDSQRGRDFNKQLEDLL